MLVVNMGFLDNNVYCKKAPTVFLSLTQVFFDKTQYFR